MYYHYYQECDSCGWRARCHDLSTNCHPLHCDYSIDRGHFDILISLAVQCVPACITTVTLSGYFQWGEAVADIIHIPHPGMIDQRQRSYSSLICSPQVQKKACLPNGLLRHSQRELSEVSVNNMFYHGYKIYCWHKQSFTILYIYCDCNLTYRRSESTSSSRTKT